MTYNWKEVFTNSNNLNLGKKLVLWSDICLRIIEFVLSIVTVGLCCGCLAYYTTTAVVCGTAGALLSLIPGAIFGFLSNFIRPFSHPLLRLISDILSSLSCYIGGILTAVYFTADCTVTLDKIYINDKWYSRTKTDNGCRIGKAIAVIFILLGICYNISTLISGVRVYKDGPFNPKGLKHGTKLVVNNQIEDIEAPNNINNTQDNEPENVDLSFEHNESNVNIYRNLIEYWRL